MRVSDGINHAYPVPSISHPEKACHHPGCTIIRRSLSPVPAAAGVMAAASANPRTGSPRAQLPPSYYDGYLEKRGPKEKVSGSGASLRIVSVRRCQIHNAQRAHGSCAYCLVMGEVSH